MPGRKERLRGGRSAQARTRVLPRVSRICIRPSAEPMQSPSGRSCAINKIRCAGSMRASAAWTRPGSSWGSRLPALSFIFLSPPNSFFFHALDCVPAISHRFFVFANEFKDAATLFDGCIQLEYDLGHVAQDDAARQFVEQQAGWRG